MMMLSSKIILIQILEKITIAPHAYGTARVKDGGNLLCFQYFRKNNPEEIIRYIIQNFLAYMKVWKD